MAKNMNFYYERTKDNSLKVFDPVITDDNGNILPYEIPFPYSQVFLTKEMQRMRDITQNGASVFDFPDLKYNNRLAHSIEAFYMMDRLLKQIEKQLPNNENIPKKVKRIALLGISVHDIGHGPGSHLFEKISNGSHEERTADILENPDTEIHKLLVSLIGKENIKLIEGFIIANPEKISTNDPECDKYISLIASLTSNSIDSDKLAYLQGDAYYSGVRKLFNADDVINAINITIDANGNYIPTVEEKKLTSIEAMRNFRAQMYRDVYYSKADQILSYYYPAILNLYKRYSDSVTPKLPEQFIKLVENPNNLSIEDFLKITEKPLIDAMDVIRDNSTNPLLAYMCDREKLIKDCRRFKTQKTVEEVKRELLEVFGDIDLSNTNSVFNVSSTIKVRKKKEDFLIDCGNNLVKANSNQADMLLEPKQDQIYKSYLIFNPEILRLELEMTPEQFAKYNKGVAKIMEDMDKKAEEFELKYIIPSQNDTPEVKKDIIEEFFRNGWAKIQHAHIQNNDEYYDTKNFDLLKKGGSLRIRKSVQDVGKEKHKGTYKMPTEENAVYSSRQEIEENLDSDSLIELVTKLSKHGKDIDTDIIQSLMGMPLLNSKTNRDDIVLEKDGIRVCLSFDKTIYKNHAIPSQLNAQDSMIEIEALGNIRDRVVLNEISSMLQEKFKYLKPNKENKYKRGMKKTFEQKAKLESKEIDR